MSIAVRFSFLVGGLDDEEDLEAVRAAIEAHVRKTGWHPDIECIEASHRYEHVWFASNWDHPIVVSNGVDSTARLDRELRELVLQTVARVTPVFETKIEFPERVHFAMEARHPDRTRWKGMNEAMKAWSETLKAPAGALECDIIGRDDVRVCAYSTHAFLLDGGWERLETARTELATTLAADVKLVEQ